MVDIPLWSVLYSGDFTLDQDLLKWLQRTQGGDETAYLQALEGRRADVIAANKQRAHEVCKYASFLLMKATVGFQRFPVPDEASRNFRLANINVADVQQLLEFLATTRHFSDIVADNRSAGNTELLQSQRDNINALWHPQRNFQRDLVRFVLREDPLLRAYQHHAELIESRTDLLYFTVADQTPRQRWAQTCAESVILLAKDLIEDQLYGMYLMLRASLPAYPEFQELFSRLSDRETRYVRSMLDSLQSAAVDDYVSSEDKPSRSVWTGGAGRASSFVAETIVAVLRNSVLEYQLHPYRRHSSLGRGFNDGAIRRSIASLVLGAEELARAHTLDVLLGDENG